VGGAGGGAATAGSAPVSDGGSEEPAGDFQLTVGDIAAVDNSDCNNCACDACPAYPPANTGLGGAEDISPAMSWPAGPDGTLSYAIVLKDLSNDTSHWALWDIPASVTSLTENLPANGETQGDLADAKQATGFNRMPVAYFGSGACDHVYEFKLYALGVATLPEPAGTSADAVRDAIEASTDMLASSWVRVRSDFSEGCSPRFAPDCSGITAQCVDNGQ
jgi:phosphatidylethanolamine-binding protein (PEBP) family uncharacterized protein